MIYGYLRTSRTAVDGLAGMHPETQLQALADAGVEGTSIFQDVGISGSVLVSDRPGWTELDPKLRRGDTLTVAALDRVSRNRLGPGGRRGVAAPARGGPRFPGSGRVLAPSAQRPHHRGRADDGGDNPAGDGLGRPSGTGVDPTPHCGGHRRAAEEGRYPRRPKALTPEQTAAARLLRRGQSQSAVARTFGVSRQTIWRAEQSE